MDATNQESKRRQLSQDTSDANTTRPPPMMSEKSPALDEKVTERVIRYHTPTQEMDFALASYLLGTIVGLAPDYLQLDKKYSSRIGAESLINDNSWIIDHLTLAWKEKSYDAIRALSILKSSLAKSIIHSPHRARILGPESHVTAIQRAWKQPYDGALHEILWENINEMTRTEAFSNSVEIIQSSGTGKSRMVHEQSNLVFTIPFNLRETSDDADQSYPYPDVGARNYLVRATAMGNVHDIKAFYLVFLEQLFKEIRAELLFMASNVGAVRDYAALAESWRVHLEDGTRDPLYASVTRNAWKRMDDIRYKHREQHDQLVRTESPDPLNLYSTAKEANLSLESLLSAIDSCVTPSGRTSDAIKLVVYFDEADVLTSGERFPENADSKHLYDILCSCFNYFLGQPVFFIFLSTKSLRKPFAFYPMESSAGAGRNQNALQAPITEVPFDCHPDLLVRPGELMLKDVCSIEFMAKFGRPLFWTLIEGAGLHKYEIVGGLIDFARAKLLRTHNFNVPQTYFSPTELLAVVDIRLMLDYNSEPPLRALYQESELVENHMRIAYSLSQDRVSLHSGYSSEPILAEAAAQQMHRFRQAPFSSLVEILVSHSTSGLLDRSKSGDLVARTLVTLAYDRAVDMDHPSRNETPPLYSQGCSVITFIEQLFSEEHSSTILSSLPDNISGGITFREAFKNATIRFTHFVKMIDRTGNSSDAMFAAFVRGMAVYRSDEKLLDFLLPVLLWDEGLCESVMTAIMVQVKRPRRMGACPEAEYGIDEKDAGLFREPSEQEATAGPFLRPYITLLMELGVQKKIPTETAETSQSSDMASEESDAESEGSDKASEEWTPSERYLPQPGRNRYSAATHPRYSIFAYGCSSAVYNMIEGDEAKFASLLAYRNFLDDHPSSWKWAAGSLKAARRMKPLWATGDDCYHWVEDESLNTPPEAGSVPGAGWVVTGSIQTEGGGENSDGDQNHQTETETYAPVIHKDYPRS